MEEINSKVNTLSWGNDFIRNVLPDEKVWSYCADDGIELDLGISVENPDDTTPYVLGNSTNVNALVVGGTGSGKSVFIRQLMSTLTRKYSPHELILWMLDCKGHEFSDLIPTCKGTGTLPHLSECRDCSNDIGILSAFTALQTKVSTRVRITSNAGFESVSEFNKAVRAGNVYKVCDSDTHGGKYINTTEPTGDMTKLGLERVIPRLLVIIDEFQVMEDIKEESIKNQVKTLLNDITELAERASVNIIFCSQSITVPSDFDILSKPALTIALRCHENVSMQVMGSTCASDIKEKCGYLCVKSPIDNPDGEAKKYRTPYISDRAFKVNAKYLSDKCAKEIVYSK